jgi:PAS domain-containing protein
MEETKSYSYTPPAAEVIALQPLSLMQVLGHLSFAVLVTDEHLTVLFCNQKFCSLFDTRSMNPLLEGVNWLQLLQKMNNGFADATHVSSLLTRAIHNQFPLQKQTTLLANGQRILFDYLPVIADQKVTCHLHIFNDDVQNQQAIDQLQNEKHFLENILEHVPADIAVFSPDARYLYLNAGSVKDKALRQWMIGKTDFDYCQKRNKAIGLAENRKKICQKATNSKTAIEWEETTDHSTGEKVHHLRNMCPVVANNGTVNMLIGYGINITERKKIEERIQISEKRYRDLFNYSQAIICTHNLEGTLLTVNPALCEKLAVDGWEMADGSWRLADGSWELAVGS